MSEMIRKITGITGLGQTNYIPVVYYCVCSSAANEAIKTANWIGTSDGTEVSPDNFELYKGIALAVLFENGFGIEEEPPAEGFKLKLYNNDAKRMLLEGEDIAFNKVNPNTVVLLLYDGIDFRLAGGLSGAQFEDFKKEIIDSVSGLEDFVVFKGGEFNDESRTGGDDQPVYVNASQVVAIASTFGSPINPIWIDSGHFKASDGTVGQSNQPVFLSSGSITATTATIGADTTPLKMVNGALVPVSAALATESALNNEVERATDAENNLSERVDDLEDSVKSIDEELKEINDTLDDHTESIETLEGRIDNLQDKAHLGGNYSFAAADSSSGLTASVNGEGGAQPITLSIPIYWGNTEPTLTDTPVGSVYLKIE